VTTLAFLGPEGTFAHAALRALASTQGAHLLPLANVTLAIDAVRGGEADGALVPLENSVEGAVPATLDELATGDPLVIAEETYLQVSFELLARPGTRLDGVRTIATHPHAEAQVRRWLLQHLPDAEVTLVGSTAGAAQAVAAGEFDAAVSSAVAGELYALDALASNIADTEGAVTRFVLLTRPAPPPPSTGNDRTTLVAYLREDHSGALLEILSEFATRAVNLTRIESRPTKGRIGQYCFSIDCEGHIGDERVGDALAALHRRRRLPRGRRVAAAGPRGRARVVTGRGRCWRRCARPPPRGCRAPAAAGSRRRRSRPHAGRPG
jgi:prephenate dehydratase